MAGVLTLRELEKAHSGGLSRLAWYLGVDTDVPGSDEEHAELAWEVSARLRVPLDGRAHSPDLQVGSAA